MTLTETDATVTGTGRSAFTNALKDDYWDAWDDHVHSTVKVASVVAKKKGTMGGKQSLSSVVTSLPQSAGISLLEGYTLPTADSSGFIQPLIHARDMYSRVRLTGQVIRAARGGSKFAWREAVATELKNAATQFNLNFARKLYLGKFDILATVSGFSTGTVTCYGRDARTSAAADFWKFGLHYVRNDMIVDHAATAAGAPVNQSNSVALYTVASKTTTTPSAPTFTVTDGANDPADGSFIIPGNSRNDTPAVANSSEYASISGLLEYASDLNIYAATYDITRAAGDTISGQHLTKAGAPAALNETRLSLGVDLIADNDAGGDMPTDLLCHSSVRREYVRLTEAQREYPAIFKEQGFKGQLHFAAGDALMPLTVDRDCPPGMFLIVNRDDWGWKSQSEMNSVDEGGGPRFVADQDAREYLMHKSGNTFCARPAAQGILDDVLFDTDAEVTA